MKGGFWLIMLLIGVCSVLREKIFIKKNPNSLEAESAYLDKLYTQRSKVIRGDSAEDQGCSEFDDICVIASESCARGLG